MIDFSLKQYFIFDLDGTLVDLEQLNFTSFKAAIQTLFNQELRYDEYLDLFAGSGSRKGFERYIANYSLPAVDSEKAIALYREHKAKALNERFHEVVTVKPGLEMFLEKLKEQGKVLAVGTSTRKEFALMLLKETGLIDFFDTIVTVEDVEHTKPEPDIFAECLYRMKGNIEEAVIFEDSANGVGAAKNSGIDYVVVYTKSHNDDIAMKEENVIHDYISLKV